MSSRPKVGRSASVAIFTGNCNISIQSYNLLWYKEIETLLIHIKIHLVLRARYLNFWLINTQWYCNPRCMSSV